MSERGPIVLDVLIDGAQGYEPRMTSTKLADGTFVSAEPDNMFPFLAPEDLASQRLSAHPNS